VIAGRIPSGPLFSVMQAALAPSAFAFRTALSDVERAQAARLRAVLAAARGTRQAARLGLQRVRTIAELRDAVPIRSADGFESDIEAIARGDSRVLSRDRVLRFEPSGGSSGARKLVPMTRGLLQEFQRALAPWLFDLMTRRPAVKRGPGYWSISPIGRTRQRTSGGLSVGSAEDASYFPRPLQPLLARLFAVPGAVAHLPDVESCRYVTLRCLAAAGDLAMISVWNPSFLTLMVQALDAHAERILADLEAGTCRPPGLPSLSAAESRERQAAIDAVLQPLSWPARPDRAQALRSARGNGSIDVARLWPQLALISLWTDAQAARAVAPVAARFPAVELQGKGLLATEGVVTLPLFEAPAPVLAVRSHYYEFLDDADHPHGAHELQAGRSYQVVISTSGGLLRYRLGDRVRVEGFYKQAPCLRFLGRADAVSDLVGEKLSAGQVGRALDQALGNWEHPRPAFAMLAPEWSAPPAYHLFVESEAGDVALQDLAATIEAGLATSDSYRYARELGQLGRVCCVRVHGGGAQAYEARCVALGQRAGDVKPVDLHLQTGWLPFFRERGRASLVRAAEEQHATA
jgi:hypothetical protein